MKLKHITNNGVNASFKDKLQVASTSGLLELHVCVTCNKETYNNFKRYNYIWMQ